MIWYFLVFFLGFAFGVVLTALVSVERGNEAYQAGVKFGKKYAEEMARIDRMADADPCSRCSKDANCAYCEMMERRVGR
jgi:hypothetical protein